MTPKHEILFKALSQFKALSHEKQSSRSYLEKKEQFHSVKGRHNFKHFGVGWKVILGVGSGVARQYQSKTIFHLQY